MMSFLSKRSIVLLLWFLVLVILECNACEPYDLHDITKETTRPVSSEVLEYSKDQIIYQIDEVTKTAILLKVRDYPSKKIIIHDEINGCKIIAVAERAFGDPVLKEWKQIVLPDSVTKIGERAFNLCTKLENIKLPNKLEKIDSECFFCCSSLQKINIPDSVSFIGESAFYSCISLTEVNIPKSLKTLESNLFEHCISLNGIYIHENIEKIADNIF